MSTGIHGRPKPGDRVFHPYANYSGSLRPQFLPLTFSGLCLKVGVLEVSVPKAGGLPQVRGHCRLHDKTLSQKTTNKKVSIYICIGTCVYMYVDTCFWMFECVCAREAGHICESILGACVYVPMDVSLHANAYICMYVQVYMYNV